MRSMIRRPTAALVMAGVIGLVISAGCSSSASARPDPSSMSSLSSATGSDQAGPTTNPVPSAATITLGLIATVGTAVDNRAQVAATKAAVAAVNKRGGINGHPVALSFCNENLDPNQGRACARQIIAQHPMAMVGNSVVTVEADVYQLLRDAGIANVGSYSYIGAAALDPNSYLFTPGGDYVNAAMGVYAVEKAGPRVSQIMVDTPASANFVPVVKGAVESSGGTYSGTVKVPMPSAADMATDAAVLMQQNPDAVVLNCLDSNALEIVRNMVGLGYTGKFVSPGSGFHQSDLEQLGNAANQIMFASPYAPVSATYLPGIAQFRTDIKAEQSSGDADAPVADQIVRTSETAGWLAVIATEKIADAAKATDAASFKKAIDAAENVDLGGVIPAWTPNTPVPDAAVPRASNDAFFLITWEDGKAVLSSDAAIHVNDLVLKYRPKS